LPPLLHAKYKLTNRISGPLTPKLMKIREAAAPAPAPTAAPFARPVPRRWPFRSVYLPPVACTTLLFDDAAFLVCVLLILEF
jgi:hypothetical protein